MSIQPDLTKLFQEVKRLQEEYQKTQEELKKMTVTGESGAGLVQVLMNGQHEVEQVRLEEAILKQGKDIIEELIASAVNDAVYKIKSVAKSKASQFSSLFNLPFNF